MILLLVHCLLLLTLPVRVHAFSAKDTCFTLTVFLLRRVCVLGLSLPGADVTKRRRATALVLIIPEQHNMTCLFPLFFVCVWSLFFVRYLVSILVL